MLPLGTLREALLGRLSRIAPVTLALPDALGLVAAEDVTAPALPGHPTALISGWAVDALATVGAGAYTPAPLPAASRQVRAGEPLPAGCDAVLPADAVTLDFGQSHALLQAAPGDGARLPGQDMPEGGMVIPAGARITPLRLGIGAAAGIETVRVRLPTIALRGEAGSSGLLLASALIHEDGRCRIAGPGDTPDLVLAIADHSNEAGLALTGAEACRLDSDAPVPTLLLPPRPEGLLAAWIALLAPAIARLCGMEPAQRPVRGRLAAKLTSTVGLAELSVFTASPGADLPDWTPLATGRVPWSALARADAVAVIDPASEGLPAGAILDGWPL